MGKIMKNGTTKSIAFALLFFLNPIFILSGLTQTTTQTPYEIYLAESIESSGYPTFIQFFTDQCKVAPAPATSNDSGDYDDEIENEQDDSGPEPFVENGIDWTCTAKLILTKGKPPTNGGPGELKLSLDKLVGSSLTTLKYCQSESECLQADPNGALSCLPAENVDLFSSEKQSLFNTLEDVASELSLPIFFFEKKHAPNQMSCEYNYQCDSYFCKKATPTASTGFCDLKKICRKGRSQEKVRDGLAKCEEPLELSSSGFICRDQVLLSDLGTFYQEIKKELEGHQCGVISEYASKNLAKLVLEQRSYELLFELTQEIYKNNSWFNGKKNYTKLVTEVKNRVTSLKKAERKAIVEEWNKTYQEFMGNFYDLIKANDESRKSIQFFDLKMIEEEMKKSRVDGASLIRVYEEWIKLQQKFYQLLTDDVIGPSEAPLFQMIGQLFDTNAGDKSAPLFNGDNDKKNKKRFGLSMQFTKFKDYKDTILENQYINKELLNIIEPNLFTDELLSNGKARFLDMPMPPEWINFFKQHDNDNRIRYRDGNRRFRVRVPTGAGQKIVFDGLGALWNQAVLNYYTEKASGKPDNYLIDPELNIYAGCIKQILSPVTTSGTNGAKPELPEFYKSFCTRDINGNKIIEPNEEITKITINSIVKNIFSLSILYGFNKHDRLYWSYGFPDATLAFDEKLDSSKTDKFFKPNGGARGKVLTRAYEEYYIIKRLYKILYTTTIPRQLNCVKSSTTQFNQSSIINNDNGSNRTNDLGTTTNSSNGNSNGGINSSSTNTGGANTGGANNGGNSSGNNNDQMVLSGGSTGGNAKSYSNNPYKDQLGLGSNLGSNSNQENAGLTSSRESGSSKNQNEEKVNTLGNRYAIIDRTKNGPNNASGDKIGGNKNTNYGYGGAAGYGGSSNNGNSTLSNDEKRKVQSVLNNNQQVEVNEDSIFSVISGRYSKTGFKRLFSEEDLSATPSTKRSGNFQRFAPQ